MRDLTGQPGDAVAAERSRVAEEGWGARLLSLQADDGEWGGGTYSPKWTSTTYTLLQLRDLGVDPAADRMRRAVDLVDSHVSMGQAEWPYFSYRGETCITGIVLSLAAYFGKAGDDVIQWLLDEQLEDGGWNCATARGSQRSSFNTTILVLEGLLEYEMSQAGRNAQVSAARIRGHEYLMDRGMFRSLSTGNIISPSWTRFSFPPRWHYDVLRGLDYLRAAAVTPDPRLDDAIDLVESKRTKDGRWPLQNHHKGTEHFLMEPGPGKPSRWNTLRAMRVLGWYRFTGSPTTARQRF